MSCATQSSVEISNHATVANGHTEESRSNREVIAEGIEFLLCGPLRENFADKYRGKRHL